MPRTHYHRKRPGHRAWITDLWRVLHPFLAPSSPGAARGDTAGLHGLSPEQADELRAILAELGEEFRIGLNVAQLPEAPPDFFMAGAEMPASRIGMPSPRLRYFLKPRGRLRKGATHPLRPQQAEVDNWMLGRAGVAFARGDPALKEPSVVAECMVATHASRAQARVGFSRLPQVLRRQRGQHDRWVPHHAPEPEA
jgi:hypothetical protein